MTQRTKNWAFLTGATLTALIIGYMIINGTLSITLAAIIVGILLTALVALALIAKSRPTSNQSDAEERFSDPIFVNETWILRR